jgi:uncharacterized protein DUF6399
MGDDYHPFDLSSGRPCDADAVRQRLTARFAAIDQIAEQTDLATKARERVNKGWRVLGAMVATIARVWLVIRTRVDSLRLSPPTEAGADRAIDRRSVPGAGGGQGTLPCRTRRHHAGGRSPPGPGPCSGRPLAALPAEQREAIEREAAWGADLFPRSSSCVEGRHGPLSLRHHHPHQLSPRRLEVLTIIPNYLIRRSDGTTAAERCFGAEPQDLFEYVLDRLDVPARPAALRSP